MKRWTQAGKRASKQACKAGDRSEKQVGKLRFPNFIRSISHDLLVVFVGSLRHTRCVHKNDFCCVDLHNVCVGYGICKNLPSLPPSPHIHKNTITIALLSQPNSHIWHNHFFLCHFSYSRSLSLSLFLCACSHTIHTIIHHMSVFGLFIQLNKEKTVCIVCR